MQAKHCDPKHFDVKNYNVKNYDAKLRATVHAFLDWWESPDAYVESRKPAKLRNIAQAFITYATYQCGKEDHRVMSWYNEHKDLLWRYRGDFIMKCV